MDRHTEILGERTREGRREVLLVEVHDHAADQSVAPAIATEVLIDRDIVRQ
jgi:hypothetical protein